MHSYLVDCCQLSGPLPVFKLVTPFIKLKADQSYQTGGSYVCTYTIVLCVTVYGTIF